MGKKTQEEKEQITPEEKDKEDGLNSIEYKRAIELEDDFRLEFEKALELLCNMYPRVSRIKKYSNLTDSDFRMVIYSVLLDTLREIQQDSTKMEFRDFHRKYTPNLKILYRCDFTGSEFSQIIDDSYLTPCDKEIARLFFIEKKNPNEVHAKIETKGEIGDIKTVNSHLAKEINNALLYRACIYNKDHK